MVVDLEITLLIIFHVQYKAETKIIP